MSDKNKVSWSPMPRFLLRKDAVIQSLKERDLKGKRVLEIGFGSGEMLAWALDRGAVVSGVDFSFEAHELTYARMGERIKENKVKLYGSLAEVQSNKYDYVFAFEVLEHIESDIEMFGAWLDLLNPGGELLISVPAHMRKWGDNDVWAGHVKRYEKSDFSSLVYGRDVDVVHLWNYGFPMTLGLDYLLNRNAKKRNDCEVLSGQEQKTKRSGVVRSSSFFAKVLSGRCFMLPFFLLQRLFFNLDLGSGYLFHVKKNK